MNTNEYNEQIKAVRTALLEASKGLSKTHDYLVEALTESQKLDESKWIEPQIFESFNRFVGELAGLTKQYQEPMRPFSFAELEKVYKEQGIID